MSTFATHFGTIEGRPLFFILFFLFTKNRDLVHGLDHDHGLGHGHGPVLGVVVWVGLDWRFGWTCGAPRDDPPLHTR